LKGTQYLWIHNTILLEDYIIMRISHRQGGVQRFPETVKLPYDLQCDLRMRKIMCVGKEYFG